MKEKFGSKYYDITWIRGDAIFKLSPKTRERETYFGVCEYSKRICKLTAPNEFLTPLIVRDVIISIPKQYCEEAKRCIDFDCPLNKTTRETFARAMNIKEKKLPKDFGKTLKWNKNPDGGLYDFSYITKEGSGIILKKASG